MYDNSIPFKVSPPGATIKREMKARAYSIKHLTELTGQSSQNIRAIIKGKKPITPEIAQALATAFDTSVEFWQRREQKYRAYVARAIPKTPKNPLGCGLLEL